MSLNSQISDNNVSETSTVTLAGKTLPEKKKKLSFSSTDGWFSKQKKVRELIRLFTVHVAILLSSSNPNANLSTTPPSGVQL